MGKIGQSDTDEIPNTHTHTIRICIMYVQTVCITTRLQVSKIEVFDHDWGRYKLLNQ